MSNTSTKYTRAQLALVLLAGAGLALLSPLAIPYVLLYAFPKFLVRNYRQLVYTVKLALGLAKPVGTEQSTEAADALDEALERRAGSVYSKARQTNYTPTEEEIDEELQETLSVLRHLLRTQAERAVAEYVVNKSSYTTEDVNAYNARAAIALRHKLAELESPLSIARLRAAIQTEVRHTQNGRSDNSTLGERLVNTHVQAKRHTRGAVL